jgi:energy-coupling factor transport system permease protein
MRASAGFAFAPTYRPLPSPLHAAGAGPVTALCAGWALVCVLFGHPLILAATMAAVLAAGTAAGVGRDLRRALWLALPLGLLVALINPLVTTDGATLLVRGDTVLGHRFDITLEAVAAGGIAGLRVATLCLAFALFSACVDQDRVLALVRRFSYRSALTTVLATRLVPVLSRDAARMSDASRCRPRPPGRFEVSRAALSGALERAVDVAAALEVRGYSSAVRPARRLRRRSRHDVRVMAAAVLVLAGAVALRASGAGWVEQYPALRVALGAPEVIVCAIVLAGAALPFAGRSARLGVARV